jgi:type III secretory pathway component EscS
MFDTLLSQTFLLVLVLSAIPLALSALLGLLVSVLQAATQIQEQSVSFVVRFGGMCLVFFFLGHWYANQVLELFYQTFGAFAALGHWGG